MNVLLKLSVIDLPNTNELSPDNNAPAPHTTELYHTLILFDVPPSITDLTAPGLEPPGQKLFEYPPIMADCDE